MIRPWHSFAGIGMLAIMLAGCNDRSQRQQPQAAAKPDAKQPEIGKPNAANAEPSKSDGGRADEPNADAVKAHEPAKAGEKDAAADTKNSAPPQTKPDNTQPEGVKTADAPTSPPKPTDAQPAVEKSAESATEKAADKVAEKDAVKVAEKPAAASNLAASTPQDAEPAEHEGDYTQWASSTLKNNVCKASGLPETWDVGKVDPKTGKRDFSTMKNIKWAASLGSQTYANPAISGGKVLIGTNNGNGYLKRYPADVDLGVLQAFTEAEGKFLWQYSSEKLPTGKVHDWELLGVCSTPIVEGDRAWFVDNRGEVVCVDTEGFYDNEDDGPVTGEWARLLDVAKDEDPVKDPVATLVAGFKDGKLGAAIHEGLAKLDIKIPDKAEIKPGMTPSSWTFTTEASGQKRNFRMRMEGPKLSIYWQTTVDDKLEADVVWKLDMMKELGTSQHNATSCSGLIVGDLLFMCSSNGVDGQHNNVPAPNAPSYICMEKATGKVIWTDNSPGVNILHGQWSSPAAAVLGGVPQVIFACGDGWLRSFRAERTTDGKAELLWKFDCNPKDSLYEIRGLGTRNHIIGTPVVYKGHVFVAVGEDPEHGDGVGHLWCVDPTKRGDVSETLAVNRADPTKPLEIPRLDPARRLQTIDAAKGEVAVPNKNSAVVWHYTAYDVDGNGEIDDLQEKMHRSLSTVTIRDDILYTADFSGIIHCLDAKTGKSYWTHDMLGACWGSALIADGKVYIGDEDGDLYIFEHSKTKKWLNQDPADANSPTINMGSSVLGTPIVANNVLYIFNKNTLFAIPGASPAAGK